MNVNIKLEINYNNNDNECRKKINLVAITLLIVAFNACGQAKSDGKIAPGSSEDVKTFPEAKPNAYWKKVLSPEAYEIMVNKGTETPFNNPILEQSRKGNVCKRLATGVPLFSSDAKFESGTGWPKLLSRSTLKAIMIVKDNSFGMERDEVVERSTGLHLGHVFNDGPAPIQACVIAWTHMP